MPADCNAPRSTAAMAKALAASPPRRGSVVYTGHESDADEEEDDGGERDDAGDGEAPAAAPAAATTSEPEEVAAAAAASTRVYNTSSNSEPAPSPPAPSPPAVSPAPAPDKLPAQPNTSSCLSPSQQPAPPPYSPSSHQSPTPLPLPPFSPLSRTYGQLQQLEHHLQLLASVEALEQLREAPAADSSNDTARAFHLQALRQALPFVPLVAPPQVGVGELRAALEAHHRTLSALLPAVDRDVANAAALAAHYLYQHDRAPPSAPSA